jgi:hypothetical protein
VSDDVEFVIISKRRFPKGGPKVYARGCDESGNCANCVESETIMIRHITDDMYTKIVEQYSYTQLRASMPFFWNDANGKFKLLRSLESSQEAFLKHSESLWKDYDCKHAPHPSLVYLNLLA